MVQIHTSNDIIRALREDAELLREVRRAILTDDVLALPAQFAAMLETQNEMLKTQNKMLGDIAELRETQSEMLKTQDEILRRLGNIETRFGRFEDDFGKFRGNYTETSARRDYYGIAFAVSDAKGWDLRPVNVRVVSPAELGRLVDDERFDRLSSDYKVSFLRTDLTVEISRPDGEFCYIMAQASHTCNGRDTSRAISHSRTLSSITRRETIPVIAGVQPDREIQPLIDVGAVFWYPIEERKLTPGELS